MEHDLENHFEPELRKLVKQRDKFHKQYEKLEKQVKVEREVYTKAKQSVQNLESDVQTGRVEYNRVLGRKTQPLTSSKMGLKKSSNKSRSKGLL